MAKIVRTPNNDGTDDSIYIPSVHGTNLELLKVTHWRPQPTHQTVNTYPEYRLSSNEYNDSKQICNTCFQRVVLQIVQRMVHIV
jgi:hypothetical protein